MWLGCSVSKSTYHEYQLFFYLEYCGDLRTAATTFNFVASADKGTTWPRGEPKTSKVSELILISSNHAADVPISTCTP